MSKLTPVLEQVRVDASQKVYQIHLPFECDRQLCRRDDWGSDNVCQGIEIGTKRRNCFILFLAPSFFLQWS